MSPLYDQFGRPLETMRPAEKLINRFAGETLPNLIPNLKERLKSISGKGFDMIKNAFKGPTTYNQLELKLKPASAFQEAMDLTKSQRFRPAGVLSGLGGPALRVGAPAIAGGLLAGMAVDRQRTGKEKGFTSGRGEGRRGAVETGGGGQIPVVTYADGSRVPGISNNGDQVEQGSALFNQGLSDLERINRMRQELEQARAAQLARADVNIDTDDPIAPPVEPPAPIDYMGAIGKEMRKGPAKAMQTSYDDGSVAPFAYTPDQSPSTDDLKSRYRAAFLDPNVGSMEAMRNAENVLGIKFAGGKYYLDSGRVDADGNPIPEEITDIQRRQLKNFEISPTQLQMKLNEGSGFDNIGAYSASDGLNATEMPKYPLFTADLPVNPFNEFDYADVVAALEDLGEKYVPYFTDIDRSRLGF